MKKINHKDHPYHNSVDKNLIQRLLDWGLPIGLFVLYFYFYNFGKFSPSEMVKTTGLMSISLLAITLIAGPLAWFMPALDVFKAHRKFWGISSFLFLLIHLGLVFVFYFQFSFAPFFNSSSPKFTGLMMGLLAFAILLLITLTSTQKALQSLDPKVWKMIQSASYIALILAVGHFYFMEQVNGTLVIKRTFGQLTFGFAVIVVLVRLLVLILPHRKK